MIIALIILYLNFNISSIAERQYVKDLEESSNKNTNLFTNEFLLKNHENDAIGDPMLQRSKYDHLLNRPTKSTILDCPHLETKHQECSLTDADNDTDHKNNQQNTVVDHIFPVESADPQIICNNNEDFIQTTEQSKIEDPVYLPMHPSLTSNIIFKQTHQITTADPIYENIPYNPKIVTRKYTQLTCVQYKAYLCKCQPTCANLVYLNSIQRVAKKLTYVCDAQTNSVNPIYENNMHSGTEEPTDNREVQRNPDDEIYEHMQQTDGVGHIYESICSSDTEYEEVDEDKTSEKHMIHGTSIETIAVKNTGSQTSGCLRKNETKLGMQNSTNANSDCHTEKKKRVKTRNSFISRSFKMHGTSNICEDKSADTVYHCDSQQKHSKALEQTAGNFTPYNDGLRPLSIQNGKNKSFELAPEQNAQAVHGRPSFVRCNSENVGKNWIQIRSTDSKDDHKFKRSQSMKMPALHAGNHKSTVAKMFEKWFTSVKNESEDKEKKDEPELHVPYSMNFQPTSANQNPSISEDKDLIDHYMHHNKLPKLLKFGFKLLKEDEALLKYFLHEKIPANTDAFFHKENEIFLILRNCLLTMKIETVKDSTFSGYEFKLKQIVENHKKSVFSSPKEILKKEYEIQSSRIKSIYEND